MLLSLGLLESLAHKIVSKIKILLYVTAICNWKGETGAEEPCGISFEIFKLSNWVGSFGRILGEWFSLMMSPGHFCKLAQSGNQNEELEATH